MSRVYIVVNVDLDMSCGKTCSQVAHAMSSLQLSLLKNPTYMPLFINWLKAGSPVIVLKAKSKEYAKLKEYLVLNNILFESIIDAGLTQVVPNSETCLGTLLSSDKEITYIHKYNTL